MNFQKTDINKIKNKIIKFSLLFSFLLTLFIACKKENKDRWNIDISSIQINPVYKNFSSDFYNLQITIPELKEKYPYFLKNSADSITERLRKDTLEQNIYKEISKTIDLKRNEEELTSLFKQIKYYYPDFIPPEVYYYSTGETYFMLSNVLEPISLNPSQNILTIDLAQFMGDGNKYYKGIIYDYLQPSMNKENIAPKVSYVYAELFTPQKMNNQNFISKMIYYGKLLILQDAFLPGVLDEYKIAYNSKQLQWVKENEHQIWNYFIENQLIFSSDKSLSERFLQPAPYSKFYLAIDQDNPAPGRIACWIGWQIAKKYLSIHPEISLIDFINDPDAEKIFNESKYKP